MKVILISAIVILITFSSCANPDKSGPEAELKPNPVLAGFYPDPSMCRVGDDYYLVTSTFAYYPGLPLFHSKNLADWQLIGYVLDRPEQLDLTGLGVSRGLFAPSIRYNNGIFYVTCTLVDGGGNFVVTAERPEGPWINPAWIPEINGIDPSLFFDTNGKTYIVYNSVAPDNYPLYEGHRTIRMYEFDINELKVTGMEKILVDGGVNIIKKPVWIEAPHIFYMYGFYYLIAAEGGTAEQHSEVVFRSKGVWGPYTPYEKNPILTQRDLNPDRKNPVTCTGHADLVETDTGWWAVFLGCRPYPPYDKDFYNTGRETFLAPVKWIDGWPVINPDHESIQYYTPIPLKTEKLSSGIRYSGNFTHRDDFDSTDLNINWMFLRTPVEKWYDLKEKAGFLSLKLRPETCSGSGNPSFIARRQQHLKCTASTALKFNPESENEKAGLVVFQNETHFYFLCQSIKNDASLVELYRSADSGDTMDPVISKRLLKQKNNPDTVFLKIIAHDGLYSFYYGLGSEEWTLLATDIDGTFLSTKIAGGFVGCTFALYATSLGKSSTGTAHFDWFQYSGNDDIYASVTTDN